MIFTFNIRFCSPDTLLLIYEDSQLCSFHRMQTKSKKLINIIVVVRLLEKLTKLINPDLHKVITGWLLTDQCMCYYQFLIASFPQVMPLIHSLKWMQMPHCVVILCLFLNRFAYFCILSSFYYLNSTPRTSIIIILCAKCTLQQMVQISVN